MVSVLLNDVLMVACRDFRPLSGSCCGIFRAEGWGL